MRQRLAILTSLLVAGCAMTTPGTSVHQPMSVRPVPPQPLARDDGAIYRADAARLALFEDRRAQIGRAHV